MNKIQGRQEVVSKLVSSVGFGFYTEDEIRALSVKRITNPIIFDNFNNPLPNGLYDPALGPLDFKGNCATCRLSYQHCPGHFGHVELCVPVYNPLVFPLLLKLLRGTCLRCHQFKVRKNLVAQYCQQLELLEKGQLADALSLISKLKDTFLDDDETTVKDENGASNGLEAGAGVPAEVWDRGEGWSGTTGTTHTVSAAQDVVKDFLSSIQKQKCDNCKALNPTLKKEGATNIFRAPLSSKAAKSNMLREVEIDESIFSPPSKMPPMRLTEGKGKAPQSGGVEVKKGKAPQSGGVEGKKGKEKVAAREEEGGVDMEEEGNETEEELDGGDKSKVEDADKEGAGRINNEVGVVAIPVSAQKLVSATEVMEHMRLLWSKEERICNLIWGVRGMGDNKSYKAFFIQLLLVPPTRFRPPSVLNGSMFENAQNVELTKMITTNQRLVALGQKGPEALDGQNGTPVAVQASRLWTALQTHVNTLIDSSLVNQRDVTPGIRQLLERKEGLFRMNMMGKRVNYACRSVISPDPYISVNEIGIPPYFATRLTYPELVTPWNVEELRQAVENGPNIHPGATHVENEHGHLSNLKYLSEEKRIALARLLVSTPGSMAVVGKDTGRKKMVPKVVYRHLQDGDVVLVNRQPTLHKPGIMAHIVRVLHGEKTLRMHYSNCKTYNADFDGDEMNVHFPQDECGRAEAYNIVNADMQYIVPTDGKPIRDLIQDHIVAGTLMTKRGTFFTRDQFQQLLYQACAPLRKTGSAARREALAANRRSEPGKKLSTKKVGDGDEDVAQRVKHKVQILDSNDVMDLMPPAILKPKPLWTGLQLFSALMKHLTPNRPALSMSASTKVPPTVWARPPELRKKDKKKKLVSGGELPPVKMDATIAGEHDLTVASGDLVTGVVDKNQFAKYGLVHAFHEVYGPTAAGRLLSSLSRLFTSFLQMHGFTCGMDDLLLRDDVEKARRIILEDANKVGLPTHAEWVASFKKVTRAQGEGKDNAAKGGEGQLIVHHHTQMSKEKVTAEVERRLRARGGEAEAGLDRYMKAAVTPITNRVTDLCIPKGLSKPFPENSMSLMTLSGAKGANANFFQISALLGQQELEGKRVPRMASGKTLPCFPPFDSSARAGGYISDRFLSGLRPQEYYFHCMAGRDGLVDTAVKTSRSGYLQRCLIKNLEGLRVHYDYTVRDADGSVVQFSYGGDGLDPTKTGYLSQFGFMAENKELMEEKLKAKESVELESRKAKKLKKQRRSVNPAWVAEQERSKGMSGSGKADSDKDGRLFRLHPRFTGAVATDELSPGVNLGAVGEGYEIRLHDYVEERRKAASKVGGDESEADKGAKKARSKVVRGIDVARKKGSKELWRLMELGYMHSLAQPGEPVGVLAGQSVGEPSTQMTLNTFHNAGRGEANVTLGIPRLREILMTASSHISTPYMSCPFRAGVSRKQAEKIAGQLKKVLLAQILEKVEVGQMPCTKHRAGGQNEWRRAYRVKLRIVAKEKHPVGLDLAWREIVHAFKGPFLTRLMAEVSKARKRAGESGIKSKFVHDTMDVVDGGGGQSGEGEAAGDEQVPPGPHQLALEAEPGEDGDHDLVWSDAEAEEEGADAEKRRDQGTDERWYDAAEDEDEDEEREKEEEEGERWHERRGGWNEGEEAAGEGGSSGASRKKKGNEEDEGRMVLVAAAGGGGAGEQMDKGKALASAEGALVVTTPAAVAVARSTRKPSATDPSAAVGSAKSNKKKRSGGVVYDSAGGIDLVLSEDDMTCEARFSVVTASAPLMLLELVEAASASITVRCTPGVEDCRVVEPEKGPHRGRMCLQASGSRLDSFWQYADHLDLYHLDTNDIAAVLKAYGIEAARHTIVNEVTSVFAVYGVHPDQHHIGLIADHMTFQGGYQACNRIGIQSNPSPWLKMTFETSTTFLKDACIQGKVDDLSNPSARIVMGRVVELGTGAFDLCQTFNLDLNNNNKQQQTWEW